MDWNDVRYFLALSRLGSIRAAGTSLGVSHSTVARRVEALELQLAARLFDRNRDGYTLTAAGRQMVSSAERVEREMAALERGLAGKDERLAGRVRVTCCDEFVAEMIVKELAGFCERYPEIELDIVSDSRSFDLSKREADIAVRTLAVDTNPPEHLLGRKLVGVHVANYIAHEHAHRLDPEREGTSPRWISFEPRKHAELMIKAGSYPDVPLWGAFSSLSLMAQAVQEGLGMIMLPCYVGDPNPGLRRLAKPDLRRVADLWLLSHPDLRDNARFQAARTCIADALLAREDRFHGVLAPPNP